MFRPTVLILAGLAPALSARGENLPLEYFTRHDDVESVRISPDGRYLAAALNGAEGSRIAFMRRADLTDETTVGAGERAAIGGFEWVSPKRLVYSIRPLEPERMRQAPMVEIFSIAEDAGGRTLVNSYRFTREARTVTADIVSDLPGDGERVLLLERAWKPFGGGYRLDTDSLPVLSLLDIRSGTKAPVEQLPLRNASVLLDAQQRARIAIGHDEHGQHAAAWKPQSEWLPLRVPGFRSGSLVPHHYSPADRTLVFTGTAEQESRAALYRFAPDIGEATKLYAHPDFDVAGAVLALDGGAVIGARVQGDRPEYHWQRPDQPTAKLYQMLERAFPGQAVEITSATADQRFVTVLVRSDVDPGAYYVVDAASRKAELLFARRPWVDPALMRPMEVVRIRARDGLPLHGYLTRPNDSTGPYPLIVLPHDEPHATRDVWGYDWRVQLLANRGYAVLQVNYRGSAGYGADFREAGLREWGGRMQDDLTDATRWAVAQGIATGGAICIYGAGYGGYAALMAAIREPGLYSCAASYAGITDLELLFERDLPGRSAAGRAALAESLGTDRGVMRARSPAYQAQDIQAAVLLLHGERDPVASYVHAGYMNDALLDAGKRVRLETLGHGDHWLEARKNRDEVYGKLLDFFASFAGSQSADAARARP